MAWHKVLCLSSFQRDSADAEEGDARPSGRCCCCAGMANSGVVASATQTADKTTCASTDFNETALSAKLPRDKTQTVTTAHTSGMQDIGKKLLAEGFSSSASELFLSSWRKPTQKAYDIYIRKWKDFAAETGVSPFYADITEIANFLAKLYDEGASFSALNTARSALSAFLPCTELGSVGSHPSICRVLKGAFERRPALPKYHDTWDPDKVLNLLATWPEIQDLSLKQLSLRTVTLLVLLTGQRGHALWGMNVSDVRFGANDQQCMLFFSGKLKTTRAGYHTKPAVVQAFPTEEKLCPVRHLKEYIRRTQDKRKEGNGKLFLSYAKPWGEISRNTFSRWVKKVLSACGIDTTVYGSHSTRSAACSAVLETVSLKTIMKAAGWESESTFSRFYKKTVVKENLGQAVLERYWQNKNN